MDKVSIPSPLHETLKRKLPPGDHTPHAGHLSPDLALKNGDNNALLSEESWDEADFTNKRARYLDSSSGSKLFAEKKVPQSHEHWTMSSLPPELLQHVFSFVDPVSLGRLLSVSKTFNVLLNPREPLPQGSGVMRHLDMQSQDAIWSKSRRFYRPGIPRPFNGISELDMWKLIRGRGCQFCGKQSPSRNRLGQLSPWSAGPGPEGVSMVWPFLVRSCGNCLQSRLVKETELLFSTFSSLMPALPFAFFTPSFDYVPWNILRQSSAPPGLQMTKYFFQSQVEDIKVRLEEVRSLGPGAAEEWYKGLESAGREKASDAARFEQWEASGGLRLLSGTTSATSTPGTGTPDLSSGLKGTPLHVQMGQQTIGTTRSPLTAGIPPMISSLPPPAPGTLPSFPLKPMSPAPGQFSNQTQRLPNVTFIPQHAPQPKLDRNLRDVSQMKANRRAEIERRCLQLDPPIMPSTLVHMDAFAAAMQIPMALNDNAWDLLKTRLLSQRKDAKLKEEEQRVANMHLQTQAEERRQQEEQLRIAKENLDREWDEMQRPAREKIARYADELIESHWAGGKLVGRDSAAQFAADVLIHVRRRYFEMLGHDDALLSAKGLPLRLDTPTGNSVRKLKLEHMKWVYETKIKPITERFRREIFLCSACDHQHKYYALDAVIQHYAAKHTSTLSQGTAVVYWKAEWPEEPPFDPQPSLKFSSRRSEYVADGTSPLYSEYGFASSAPFETNMFRTEQRFPVASERASLQHPRSPMLSEQQITHPNLHRPTLPPKPPNQDVNGFQHTKHFASVQHTPITPSFIKPSHILAQPQTDLTSIMFAAPGSVTHDTSGQLHGTSRRSESVAVNASQLGYPPSIISNLTDSTHTRARSIRPPTGPPGQPQGIYHAQMDEVAVNARDIWDNTAGIENLPTSVRVLVIILHVVLRFSEKYTNEPNLTLFSDTLNNDSRMKPLKDIGDLTCKACLSGDAHSSVLHGRMEPATWIGDVYTLFELLRHFQTIHIETDRSRYSSVSGLDAARPDWKWDMIQLPEAAVIESLVNAQGMTDAKLSLIANVLPKYFSSPLPKMEGPTRLIEGSSNTARNLVDSTESLHIRSASAHLSETQRPLLGDLGEQFTNVMDTARRPSLDRQVMTGPTADHEYDPHRPAPAYNAPQRFEADHTFPYPRTEQAYARRIIYRDARSGTFMDERPYAVEKRQPQVVYRVRDYPSYEPPANYQQEYYRPEPYERDPARPISRDRMYQFAQREHHRDHYAPSRSRTFIDGRESASPASRPLKQEIVPNPDNDSLDDTEQFLNNFDNIAAEAYPDADAAMPTGNFAEGPDREPENDRPVTRVESLRGTPREIARSRDGRERSKSPLQSFSRRPEQGSNFVDEPMRSEQFVQGSRSTFRSREPEGDEGFPGHSRTRVIEYDQNGLPLTAPHLTSYQSTDMHDYLDGSPPRGYQPRHLVAPTSPEFYRPHLAGGHVRYAEVGPARQYRIVDDGRYLDRGYEPMDVEYVRMAPREAQPLGRYYVERARQQVPEYIEQDGHHRRNQVYEREGQYYTTAAPADRRYDPYDMPARY